MSENQHRQLDCMKSEGCGPSGASQGLWSSLKAGGRVLLPLFPCPSGPLLKQTAAALSPQREDNLWKTCGNCG